MNRRSGKRNGWSIKDTGSDTRVKDERGSALPGSLDGGAKRRGNETIKGPEGSFFNPFIPCDPRVDLFGRSTTSAQCPSARCINRT